VIEIVIITNCFHQKCPEFSQIPDSNLQHTTLQYNTLARLAVVGLHYTHAVMVDNIIKRLLEA